jgi:transglutaminase-like putative cysteine protease
VIVNFGVPVDERGTAGDVVSTRVVKFGSQAEQIIYLRQVIDEYRGLYAIRERARDIVFRQRYCPPKDKLCQALAIGSWVQRNITYVEELPEIFQTPPTTIAQGYGDCDDMAPLVGCLLEAIGIEAQLVGMEWDDPDGERSYHHIFCQALFSQGGQAYRIPLDTTLGTPVENLTDPIAVSLGRGDNLRVFTA